ncbi:MAG: response regulator [Ectothiorhodospiraceae bacterium]|nr:response regulator [Ectothiorhodospiraceae bacterium]MCH8506802.1 response regulator [Ectothiorhodospiraceae bacterium]
MAKTVLIVDDEPNILLSLEFLMKQSGYVVQTAENGEQALEMIRQAPPDLVLLDVMMPRKDGFQVCQEIRQEHDTGSVRIIMLTAKGRHSEQETGLGLGADDYVTKPFSTQDVVHKVQRLLGD